MEGSTEDKEITEIEHPSHGCGEGVRRDWSTKDTKVTKKVLAGLRAAADGLVGTAADARAMGSNSIRDNGFKDAFGIVSFKWGGGAPSPLLPFFPLLLSSP